MIICPICCQKNVGDCEVDATIKNQATSVMTKKRIYACYSCGILFVEAEMTSEQIKLKQEYQALDPFKR
jgi:hypothetical protein